MTRLGVAMPASGSPGLAEQRAVLASLPTRFALDPEATAEITLLDPLGSWWEALPAALDARPAAVVLPDPRPAPQPALSELVQRARRASVPVLVMRRHDAAALAGGLGDLADESAPSVSVLSVVPADEAPARLGAALLDQLALLRGLGLQAAFHRVHVDRGAYIIAGPRAPILSGLISRAAAPRVELSAVSLKLRRRLCFDDGAPATPSRLLSEDAAGRAVRTLGWESGYRAAWQALHASLETGAGPSSGLDDLLAAQTLATPVLDRLTSPTNQNGAT